MILRVYKSCNGNDVRTTCVSARVVSSKRMKRPLLALLILCCSCALAHGQSLTRRAARPATELTEGTADQVVAARAIFLLKRLDDDVIVYRSLGDFEESGKHARVSFEVFKNDLREVSPEVEALAFRLTDKRLQTEMRNTLASYRDGMFWWQQAYQPRVINVSSLSSEPNRTPTDTFLQSNTPYTVAIYWRQANKYLQRAVRQAASLSPE